MIIIAVAHFVGAKIQQKVLRVVALGQNVVDYL
jgi:hypothetical protein